MAKSKPRARKTAYVPRVVFAVTVAAVVPSLAPASCGGETVGVACTSFCGVAAVAMGGFGGVAAVAMGGFGGVGGTGGTGGTTGTGGAGGSGGTATGTGGTAGGGGTASLVMPADPRAVDTRGDAARLANKSPRASRSRRRG